MAATSAAHSATTDRPIVRFAACATAPITTGPNSSPKYASPATCASPSAAWMPFTRAAAANSTGIMLARPRPINVKPVSTATGFGSSSAPIIPAQASDALALLASKTATSPGIWITILLAVLMALVLKRTVFGVHTYALGSNEDTARLCGVPVERTKVWIYTLCGVFGGLGGVMTFARLSVGDPTTAIGKELDVIAAVVIGGASLSGGKGSILGSMVGALLMAALANGCNLTGVPNFVQEILIGSIIVAAVAVDRVRSSRR